MGITYKEYAWLTKPDDVNDRCVGGVSGCPYSYGISDCTCDSCDGNFGEEKCSKCWNREIPYSVIAEAVRDGNAGFNYKRGERFKLASCEIEGDVEIYHVDSSIGKYFISKHLYDFKYYIDKEEKKVKKEFTKADLKDGMMCERADGIRMLWISGEMRGITVWCSDTNNDLTISGRTDLSIAKVGYPDFDMYPTISQALDGDFKEILWERKQEKEISADEAFAVLKEHYGCDVKIKE